MAPTESRCHCHFREVVAHTIGVLSSILFIAANAFLFSYYFRFSFQSGACEQEPTTEGCSDVFLAGSLDFHFLIISLSIVMFLHLAGVLCAMFVVVTLPLHFLYFSVSMMSFVVYVPLVCFIEELTMDCGLWAGRHDGQASAVDLMDSADCRGMRTVAVIMAFVLSLSVWVRAAAVFVFVARQKMVARRTPTQPAMPVSELV